MATRLFTVDGGEPSTIGQILDCNMDYSDDCAHDHLASIVEILESLLTLEIGETYGDGANMATTKRVQ